MKAHTNTPSFLHLKALLLASLTLFLTACGPGPVDHHKLSDEFRWSSVDSLGAANLPGFACGTDSLFAFPINGRVDKEARLPGEWGFNLEFMMQHYTVSEDMTVPQHEWSDPYVLDIDLLLYNYDLRFVLPDSTEETDWYDCVPALEPGFVVSSSRQFGREQLVRRTYSHKGNFICDVPTEPYFIGFSYDPGRKHGDHYGWMKVNFDTCAYTFEVLEYAIANEPWAPIAVGQTE